MKLFRLAMIGWAYFMDRRFSCISKNLPVSFFSRR